MVFGGYSSGIQTWMPQDEEEFYLQQYPVTAQECSRENPNATEHLCHQIRSSKWVPSWFSVLSS